MKILHLSIIIGSVISFMLILNCNTSWASLDVSPTDLYKQSDVIVYGQVLAKDSQSSPDYLYYQVNPLQYIKGAQSSQTVTLAEKIADRSNTSFEVGDKVLFFLNRIGGVVLVSPYSQKAGAACDIHSFLGPGLLPGEKMPISSMAAGSLRIFDTFGNVVSTVHQNQYLMFEFDNIWNEYPQARNITATMVVRLDNSTQPIFDQKQVIPLLACDGPAKVKWNFVPSKTGNYSATLLFDKYTLDTDFEVMTQPAWMANPNIIWWGGSSIQLKVSKTDVLPGDTVNLIGRTLQNSTVKISFMKPNLTTEDLGSTTSDGLGHFHMIVKIPENAESGIWRITSQGSSIAMSSPAITVEQMGQCCSAINSTTLITPLQQLEYGIPSENVQCDRNLVLIIKPDDQSPRCVKPDAAQKLIERGWAIQEKKTYHLYFPGQGIPILYTKLEKIVSGVQEAESIVGYPIGTPIYLPSGYSIQDILVDNSNSTRYAKILASDFPIPQNMTNVEFIDKGGIMIYTEPTTPAFNLTRWTAGWLEQNPGSSTVQIDGYSGVVNDITKGKRFEEDIDIPADLVVFGNGAEVEISGFVHSSELIKIAQGMLGR